ncbi:MULTISPECIES: serine/threonine dehydratase [Nocardiopsis]|uniref:Pyridoxal-5'-phosphate-dependent protein beta subunit n=3 Tax=Nocardiopsis TaxID=2013 RepID=D7B5L3_NOCDD|nr:serine/threonine dehydratase [Nocardiopsis dassonvillei]ADH67280.1 Pyridoxal-5'-phosphate-dependent protein beta subunit [Nocardiopsis dassonvillei subsp. dassonvillei DSM 43111]APC35503.1 threonine dehydratase [Nocardiopsis dassonvillei]NKY81520.1 serine/threonine dehydratase [Nocardiopsis dassonvillei]VEI87384.1 L-threonine dehydratase catabolic TdcB [Nocardiopsis dassonvillei]
MSTTTAHAAPTATDVRAAAERIAPYARRTPVMHAEVDGRPLTLKLEHLQRTGAFKLRGALNALLGGEAADRVITASGGNHGLGVATAARLLGVRATVYVPESIPEAKAAPLAATGAEVVRVGEHYAVAAEAARARAEAEGVRYLHAFDDALVVAGQGTIGLEIAADAPECDTIVVAVGGGGLVAGVRLGAEGREVVGAEPEGCASMHAAMAAGHPVQTPVDSVASSALGAATLGRVPFEVLSAHPVTRALVSDAEILRAQDRLWEEFRIATEPAAAVPFAAWLAGRVPGERPCLVVCGANAEWRRAD